MNDDLDSKPVDLTSLDPTRDSARFDAIVTAIVRDARATSGDGSLDDDAADDVFDRLARWWPRALIAASLIVAVSVSALIRQTGESTAVSATEVLGISRELSDVLRSNRTPSLSELRSALTTDSGQ
jgi:hypothetical protein